MVSSPQSNCLIAISPNKVTDMGESAHSQEDAAFESKGAHEGEFARYQTRLAESILLVFEAIEFFAKSLEFQKETEQPLFEYLLKCSCAPFSPTAFEDANKLFIDLKDAQELALQYLGIANRRVIHACARLYIKPESKPDSLGASYEGEEGIRLRFNKHHKKTWILLAKCQNMIQKAMAAEADMVDYWWVCKRTLQVRPCSTASSSAYGDQIIAALSNVSGRGLRNIHRVLVIDGHLRAARETLQSHQFKERPSL